MAIGDAACRIQKTVDVTVEVAEELRMMEDFGVRKTRGPLNEGRAYKEMNHWWGTREDGVEKVGRIEWFCV